MSEAAAWQVEPTPTMERVGLTLRGLLDKAPGFDSTSPGRFHRIDSKRPRREAKKGQRGWGAVLGIWGSARPSAGEVVPGRTQSTAPDPFPPSAIVDPAGEPTIEVLDAAGEEVVKLPPH